MFLPPCRWKVRRSFIVQRRNISGASPQKQCCSILLNNWSRWGVEKEKNIYIYLEALWSQIDLKRLYWAKFFTVAAKLKELVHTPSEVGARAQACFECKYCCFKSVWDFWASGDSDHTVFFPLFLPRCEHFFTFFFFSLDILKTKQLIMKLIVSCNPTCQDKYT